MGEKERQSKKIVVFAGEGWDGGMPTDDLIGVVRWFREKLAEVPREYRKSARCLINSVSDYEGSHHPSIEISYVRPETDFEHAERLIKDIALARIRREQELELLRGLQEKYGDEEA